MRKVRRARQRAMGERRDLPFPARPVAHADRADPRTALHLAQRRRQKYALRYASLSLVKEAMVAAPASAGTSRGALPLRDVVHDRRARTTGHGRDRSGAGRHRHPRDRRLREHAGRRPEAEPHGGREGSGESLRRAPGPGRVGGHRVLLRRRVAGAVADTDKDLVIKAIDRLRPQRATAIGRGILTSLDAIFENDEGVLPSVAALQRLEASGGQARPAATPPPGGSLNAPATIILLSDGQNNQFPAPLQIIDEAISRGIRVYTVGVGSAEGTILRLQGRQIRTRLDEATLKQIAQMTDAEYFNASNAADLRAVYEKLSTQLVLRQQKTEVTAYLTALAAVLSIIAGVCRCSGSTGCPSVPFASLATPAASSHALSASDR